jgi:hypothetical protein
VLYVLFSPGWNGTSDRASYLIKQTLDKISKQSANSVGQYCPEQVHHRHPPPFGEKPTVVLYAYEGMGTSACPALFCQPFAADLKTAHL